MNSYSSRDITSYPNHIFIPKGMISPGEIMLLFDLARLNFSRKGEIVNAGAFIGASAYALAAGMSENEITTPERFVHSYDLFVARDRSVADFLQNNIFVRRDRYGKYKRNIIDVDLGFKYLDVYLFQTQKYAQFLKTYEGDIKQHEWSDGDIEILFLDVCKTLDINSHVFRTFFPYLIPGVSIIVQQDFHHIYHPYIHVTLQAIREYISPIFTTVGGSRVYSYTKKIPNDLLNDVINYSFNLDTRMRLFNELIDESPINEKPLLHVALINELRLSGEKDLLAAEFDRILSLYGTNEGKAFWFQELGKICPEYLSNLILSQSMQEKGGPISLDS